MWILLYCGRDTAMPSTAMYEQVILFRLRRTPIDRGIREVALK